MRMLFATTLLAVAFASPALADPPVQREFELDGVSYHYTEEVRDGRTILRGYARPGQSFRLVVHGERVRGRVGGRHVSFSVAAAEEQREIASR